MSQTVRTILLLAIGFAAGAISAEAFLGRAKAHPLIAVNSPWAYSGCAGEAIGDRKVRWTCPVSE